MQLDPASAIISFEHLGFENFEMGVLAVMAGRLFCAAVLGGIVAFRWWRRFMPWPFQRAESGAQVLIAVSGALMTAVIGENIALAFALVGLGGFIRFRSGIKDPREAGVMFLVIGIGMACGIGSMPVALTATAAAIILLAGLDVFERARRPAQMRRVRFSEMKGASALEPKIRRAIESVATIRGSKVNARSEEIVVEMYGDRLTSAGEVIELLARANVEVPGDVSCENI
jgi:uncharacterized membrane protein YhiD involved in acid resistance